MFWPSVSKQLGNKLKLIRLVERSARRANLVALGYNKLPSDQLSDLLQTTRSLKASELPTFRSAFEGALRTALREEADNEPSVDASSLMVFFTVSCITHGLKEDLGSFAFSIYQRGDADTESRAQSVDRVQSAMQSQTLDQQLAQKLSALFKRHRLCLDSVTACSLAIAVCLSSPGVALLVRTGRLFLSQ